MGSLDVTMFIVLLLCAAVGMTIALIIFTSIFVQSRAKGYIYILMLIAASATMLISLYETSPILAAAIVILYTILAVLTCFNVKKKLNEAEIG